jgi:hypothetical protein
MWKFRGAAWLAGEMAGANCRDENSRGTSSGGAASKLKT